MGENGWSSSRNLLVERSKTRAFACLKDKEYARAFAHFIVTLSVQPEMKSELLNLFLFTLEKIALDYEKNKQVNEVLMCYEQALDVLPNNSQVLHGLGSTLFRLGFVESALSYFLKSYKANPFFTPSLYCMENLKNAVVERWHFAMLNDRNRNICFQKAIEKAIQDGYQSVLDIGAGTGILSMMASKANASHVYACESSEIMCAVLKEVLKLNEVNVQVTPKMSLDLIIPGDIPERVSLVVTEIFDAGLFGEHCLETLDHAWENLLVENHTQSKISIEDSDKTRSIQKAKVIPNAAAVFAVPVECDRFSKCIRLDDSIVLALGGSIGISSEIVEPYSSEKIQFLPCDCKMLSEPAILLEVNFNCPEEIRQLLQGKVFSKRFNCIRSGRVDAVLVWFDLILDEEISISTAPDSDKSSCWEQAIFYVLPHHFEGPTNTCSADQVIEVEFLCKSHLQLQKVKLSVDNNSEVTHHTIALKTSTVYLLNSYAMSDVINIELNKICPKENIAIFDISVFPILALKHLYQNPHASATVLVSCHQDEVEALRSLLGIQSQSLDFRSYEDICVEKTCYDLLVVDPVEMCGLLKKNLIEDVAMLRMQSLKESGKVVPAEIEIFVVLVESHSLLEQSKLVSDLRTNELQIAEVMNAYQCLIHQDIQFSTLECHHLTDPTKLCCVNLNCDDAKALLRNTSGSESIEISKSGSATAIVYWFSIQWDSDRIVNTAAPESLYKQAAFILEEEITVEKGENVSLQWCLKSSCLQISICKD